MKTTFPELLALARKREAMQFEIGDQLLRDVGPPSDFTRQDGSYAKIKVASEYLERNGVEYSMTSLAHYREIAHKFPPARRHAGISWQAHTNAGDPETLDAIVKAAKKRGQKVTVTLVRDARQAMLALHRSQVEARERQAGTFKELPERNSKEPPNKFTFEGSDRGALASAGLSAFEILSPIHKALALAEDLNLALKTADLTPDAAAAAFEQAARAVEAWRSIADQLRPKAGKGGHLSVVA